MNAVARIWFKFVVLYVAGALALIALAVYVLVAHKPAQPWFGLWIALPIAWILAYEPIMVWREWQRVKRILAVCHEKLKGGETLAPQELDGAFKFFARLGAHETGLPEGFVLWLLRKWGARAVQEIQARLRAKKDAPPTQA